MTSERVPWNLSQCIFNVELILQHLPGCYIIQIDLRLLFDVKKVNVCVCPGWTRSYFISQVCLKSLTLGFSLSLAVGLSQTQHKTQTAAGRSHISNWHSLVSEQQTIPNRVPLPWRSVTVFFSGDIVGFRLGKTLCLGKTDLVVILAVILLKVEVDFLFC